MGERKGKDRRIFSPAGQEVIKKDGNRGTVVPTIPRLIWDTDIPVAIKIKK